MSRLLWPSTRERLCRELLADLEADLQETVAFLCTVKLVSPQAHNEAARLRAALRSNLRRIEELSNG